MSLMGPRMSSIPESSKHLQKTLQKPDADREFQVKTLALVRGHRKKNIAVFRHRLLQVPY